MCNNAGIKFLKGLKVLISSLGQIKDKTTEYELLIKNS